MVHRDQPRVVPWELCSTHCWPRQVPTIVLVWGDRCQGLTWWSFQELYAGSSDNYNLKSETVCPSFLSTTTLKSEGLAGSFYYRRQHAPNGWVVLTTVVVMLWGSSRYLCLPVCLPHDTVRPLKTETPHGGWFKNDFQIQPNGSDFQYAKHMPSLLQTVTFP